MIIYPIPSRQPDRRETRPGEVYYFFEPLEVIPLLVAAGIDPRVRTPIAQALARRPAPKVQAFQAPGPPAEIIPYLVAAAPKPILRPAAPRVFSVTPDPVAPAEEVPTLVAADTGGKIRKPRSHANPAPGPGEVYYFFDALVGEIPLLVAPGVDARTRQPLTRENAKQPAPKVQAFEAPAVAPEQPVPYLVRGVQKPTAKAVTPRIVSVTPDPVVPEAIPLLVADGVGNRARAPVRQPILERRRLEAQLCGALTFTEEPQVSLVAAGVDSRTRTPVRRDARGLSLRSQIIVGRVDAPGEIPYFIAPGVEGRTRRPLEQAFAKQPAPKVARFTPDPVAPEAFPDLVAAGVGNRSRKPLEREFGKYPAPKVQAFTPVAPAPEEIPALIAAGVESRTRRPIPPEIRKLFRQGSIWWVVPDPQVATELPLLVVAGVDGRTRRAVPSHSTHGRRSQPRVLPFEAALAAPPVYGWGARGRIGGAARDPWSRIGSEAARDGNDGIGAAAAKDGNDSIGSGEA